jgi:hypothetical protein
MESGELAARAEFTGALPRQDWAMDVQVCLRCLLELDPLKLGRAAPQE